MLTVTYHGGALLTHVEAQPIFMGSDWATNSSLVSTTSSLNTYVGYLVNSNYMDMLTTAGYNVGRGTSTSGATLSLSLNKTTGLTDTQIHTNLQNAINSRQVAAPDAQRLYVVYVEPGVIVKLGSSSSRTTFLGYHGAFAGHTASGQAADIRYAVLPFPGTPNPSPSSQGFSGSFDELTSVSSHEIAEAVTDPDVNYKALGWYDDQLNGEIGDLTEQTSRLGGYLVQDLVGKNDKVIVPAPGSSGGGGGTTTLAAPTITSINAATSTSVTITWTGVAGATGYRVLLIQNGQTSIVGNVTTTSTIVTGLTAGSTASFKVEAFNSTQTAVSAAVSITLPKSSAGGTTTLAAPQVTATAISSTRALLAWNAVTGAQGYRVYWWNGFRAVLLGTFVSSTTSVRVSGLTPGSTNQFLVEAFGDGKIADSTWVSVMMPARTFAGRASARLWRS
ncbi:MAG: fibronectin type III domain-containing protein [Planctomycetia bacterium]|nr:fibronectin type III domain-containing protein [Planctomycetia bacterium]